MIVMRPFTQDMCGNIPIEAFTNQLKGANMENLSSMSDTAILNALFDIAAVEANSNGEYGEKLTLQDEQEYQRLDWELSKRVGKWGVQ